MSRPITFSDGDRVLLVASSGLGNVLQFTPALRALKGKYPRMRVDLLTFSGSNAFVMEHNPNVEEVMLQKGSFHFFQGSADGKKEARAFLPHDRKIISRLAHRKYATSINIYPIFGLRPASFVKQIGAGQRIGTPIHKKTYRWMSRMYYTHPIGVPPGAHGIDIGFSHVGMDPSEHDRTLELMVSPGEKKKARGFLAGKWPDGGGPLIGLHPGCLAERSQKRWPLKSFARLVRGMVLERECRFIVFLGPEDYDLEGPFKKLLKGLSGSVLFAVDEPLPVVAALTSLCRAFVANDSGLMHLSSAVGTPTLGLFGPTDPSRYSTPGKRDRFVYHSRDCSPCTLTADSVACEDRSCMKSITVKEVRGELEGMLGREGMRGGGKR